MLLFFFVAVAHFAFRPPLTELAPLLFPFFRHTIPNVRLAVVKTLLSFMAVPSLSQNWISTPFLRLLFQNLIVEERSDIRLATLTSWRTALATISGIEDLVKELIQQQTVLDWYAIMMTPLGVGIDSATFYHPTAIDDGSSERHNVDKIMLAQELALISPETNLQARVAAATALASLIVYWPPKVLYPCFQFNDGNLIMYRPQTVGELFQPILIHYMDSASMLQKFLAAIVAEEWARGYGDLNPTRPILEHCPLAEELSTKALAFLQGSPPTAYYEMALTLHRIHAECHSLLHCFASDCKIPISLIPHLGNEIDIMGTKPDCFTIDTAQQAVGPMYTKLKDTLGRTKKRELAVIAEKRSKALRSIEYYSEIKAQHDTRVSATFASAFVAFKSAPDKVSPVVKGIMNGIKASLLLVVIALFSDQVFRTRTIWICRHVQRSLLLTSFTFACSTTSLSRPIR